MVKLAEKDAGCGDSFLSIHSLSMAVSRWIEKPDRPAPPAKYIRPPVATAWNSRKGGADERSRELIELQASSADFFPLASALLRFAKSQA